MRRDFVEIDHSGDIGIEAGGGGVVELLENLTHGLFALQRRGTVTSRIERVLAVESGSVEDLVVDWLNEVISMSGAYGEVYGEVSIGESDGRSAAGVLRGEPVDATRHDLRFDVKAATYHGLEVATTTQGLRVRVVFDL